ncbi:hypothetical protein LPJ70_000955, partial [Coemansia sp. RSA 2708]
MTTPHSLSKKSSTTLTSERHGSLRDEIKAASMPSDSMYRFALRSTAASDSGS